MFWVLGAVMMILSVVFKVTLPVIGKYNTFHVACQFVLLNQELYHLSCKRTTSIQLIQRHTFIAYTWCGKISSC